MVTCNDCKVEIPEGEVIRCYDCNVPLCRKCGKLGVCKNCYEVFLQEEDYWGWK